VALLLPDDASAPTGYALMGLRALFLRLP